MCGIFGFIQDQKINENPQVQNAFRNLNHRGPDDRASVVYQRNGSKIVLGHTRLAIIDLSASGRQPMISANKRYTIIFNGEIYNFQELKKDLINKGQSFLTNTDTEVLLTMWSIYGTQSLRKLIGMFSFCVYDSCENSLTIIRDGFGIKPLFYCFLKNKFFFASEIKALRSIIPERLSLNQATCIQYLDQGHYDCSQKTFFTNAKNLAAGSLLKVSIGTDLKSFEEKWWVPKSTICSLSFKKAVSQCKEKILHSVQLHLRSDVPVAIALSGGIDSSIIVGAARFLNPKKEISGLCYNSPDGSISERKHQETVIKKNGCKAFFAQPSAKNLLEDLEKLISVQNEPFGGLSVYAQFKIYELAKSLGFKVVLDGQGADELFGGYYGFPGLKIVSLFKSNDKLNLVKYLFYNRNIFNNKKIIFGDLLRYFNFDEFIKRTLIPIKAKNWMRDVPLYDNEEKFNNKTTKILNNSDLSALKNYLVWSIQHLWLPSLLRHADRNAMAFSVENRVPFLTNEICDFSFSLPENFLVSDSGRTKNVLREAFKNILPLEIYTRTDKNAFEVPQNLWINNNKSILNKHLKTWLENEPLLEKSKKEKIKNLLFSSSIHNDLYWRYLNFSIWRAQNHFE